MNNHGWIDHQESVKEVITSAKFPFLATSANLLAGTGEGKTVLLHKIYENVTGRKFPTLTQAIGDCTSFALASCIHCLMSAEIFLKDEIEYVPEFLCSTEYIYGVSRVLIGKGIFKRGDGSTGAFSVEGTSKYGTLLRKKYDSIDLTNYSGQRAKEFGLNGPPPDLIPIAREHCVRTYSLVKTYEECRDAIANGYAVMICSNQGFTNVRDSDGYSKGYGTWPHALAAIGIKSDKRKGILILNSWGENWNSGPLVDQPPGSFWAEGNLVEDRMLSAGDSWAISNFDGYKPRDLSWDVISKAKEKLKNYE
jgi:hypothetical protein